MSSNDTINNATMSVDKVVASYVRRGPCLTGSGIFKLDGFGHEDGRTDPLIEMRRHI